MPAPLVAEHEYSKASSIQYQRLPFATHAALRGSNITSHAPFPSPRHSIFPIIEINHQHHRPRFVHVDTGTVMADERHEAHMPRV